MLCKVPVKLMSCSSQKVLLGMVRIHIGSVGADYSCLPVLWNNLDWPRAVVLSHVFGRNVPDGKDKICQTFG
jgi:hypothetical protein